MDSFEFNKVAGAVLGTALLVMALGIVAEAVYAPDEPEKPGYVIAVPETTEGGETTTPAAPEVAPIAARLQTADAAAGETSTRVCLTCHTFQKGQPPKVGPNLWGIVGGPAAHEADFEYSDAMLQRKAEGKTWTFDDLDQFLAAPKRYLPDTEMNFGGIKNAQQRANVIAYLRTLSDNPIPLPAATAAAPAEGAAPAETPATTTEGAPAPEPTPPAASAPSTEATPAPAAPSTPETPPVPGESPTSPAEPPAQPPAEAPAPAPAQ
jgi:cytochrome c